MCIIAPHANLSVSYSLIYEWVLPHGTSLNSLGQHMIQCSNPTSHYHLLCILKHAMFLLCMGLHVTISSSQSCTVCFISNNVPLISAFLPLLPHFLISNIYLSRLLSLEKYLFRFCRKNKKSYIY